MSQPALASSAFTGPTNQSGIRRLNHAVMQMPCNREAAGGARGACCGAAIGEPERRRSASGGGGGGATSSCTAAVYVHIDLLALSAGCGVRACLPSVGEERG